MALAVVAGLQWLRRRDPAAGWIALTFLTLGLVVLAARVTPTHPHALGGKVAQRFELALLVLFPYVLFRFTTAFRTPVRALGRFIVVMTVGLLVWSFALPSVPAAGDPRPWWFWAYLVAFLVHWTVLTIAASLSLWKAGRRQPSVARRRMDLLAFAATSITIAILLSASSTDQYSGMALAAGVVAFLSGVAFLCGIAPPTILRIMLRRPEQERLQHAIASLMTLATTEDEIAARVLQPAAGIVGARAAAIRSAGGHVIRTHGLPEGALDEGDPAEIWADAELVEVGGPAGTLMLWTSPYAPFFGDEELRLLTTLGALTSMALDRARLFGRERETRMALERSNELQANFIALAAHELRTPVTTIHGVIRTLGHLGDRLDESQREELRESLEQQAARLALLVEQLLDLSRLDAEAVPIEPKRFGVRERLAEIVDDAGPGSETLRIEVPEELETRADPEAFDRIVTNLVTNALRYGAAPVTVHAEQTDRHFRLVVEDRGNGVPPEFVPTMFERFSRSDESRSRAGGTGLGLSIARSYAVAHGGELLYTPAEPCGARFELVLPSQDKQPPEARPSSARP